MSEQMSLEQVVAEALAPLPERERYVLERRCGYRGKPVSQTKIAAEFNISGAHVGQIKKRKQEGKLGISDEETVCR